MFTKGTLQRISLEGRYALLTFLLGALLFFGMSVLATDIGTNITSSGRIQASTTVLATGNVIAYRHTMLGTTSPANLDAIGFQVGTSSYFAKYVGIGDATYLGDGILKVSGDIFGTSTIQATGNILGYSSLGIGTSTPAQEISVAGDLYVSGGGLGVGTATSTTGGLEAENADFTRLQVGTGSVVSKMQFGTCSVNPPMLKAGTGSTTACTATGITTSDKVWVTAPGLPQTNDLGASTGNIVFVAASSTAADTIRIQVLNTSTSTAVDAPSETWSWMGLR